MNLRKIFLLGLCCLLTTSLSLAQNSAITPEVLQKIKSFNKETPADQALRNAIFATDINQLAADHMNIANFDTYFSNKVNVKSVSDQKSSGRCWLFTGLNVLRSQIIAKQHFNADFELSQNYLFFYDQLEKANLFLQAMIDNKDKTMDDKTVEWLFKNPIGDGGQFTGVADLITKYGVVPKTIMPETNSSNKTSQMSNLLSLKLREFGLELRKMNNAKDKQIVQKMENKKLEMLGEIYHILTLNLGIPPTTFTYTMKEKDGKPISSKQYTPQSFFKEFCDTDFANFVMVMNDPNRDYYKVYEIEYDRHTYDGNNWKYLNLPMEEIAKIGIASIKDSTAMYFSCDVGKFLNRDKGYLDANNFNYASLMGTTFNMNKKERIATFASGSSHAMTLCAVDLDENGNPKKWMVENSWGASYGYNGCLIMTNDWFNEYMFRLVADKKYIAADILKYLNQKPIMLPPWDPMFINEE
ncbi:MAG: C1 family peptidase [Bacteroidales bacterium]|jgi:bleomycin hydrolase|nr:C1 family peptidase [Bacteroidales bacterium]